MKLALDFSVTLIITSHSSLHTKLKSKIVKEGKRHIKNKQKKKKKKKEEEEAFFMICAS